MRTLVVLFLSVALLWSPCYRRRSLSTVVFSLREASGTATPDSVIATPATGAAIAAPVSSAGHASSDAGVAAVEVAVMDQDSGLWWDAARRSWGDFVWNSADVSTPRAVTTGWSWVFTGTGGSGGYWAMARGVDTAGHVEVDRPTTDFSVTSASDTAPDTAFAAPAVVVMVTAPVVFAGHVTGDRGPQTVQVAVKDRVSGQWWDAASASWGDFAWNEAEIADGSATSMDWSWTFAATSRSGSYWTMARGKDPDGDVEGTRATTRFTVADPVEGLPTYAGNFAEPAVAELIPVDVAVTDRLTYAIDVAAYRIVAVDRRSGQVVAQTDGGMRTLGEDGMLAAARAIAVDSEGSVCGRHAQRADPEVLRRPGVLTAEGIAARAPASSGRCMASRWGPAGDRTVN
jgi:hypothetical protein